MIVGVVGNVGRKQDGGRVGAEVLWGLFRESTLLFGGRVGVGALDGNWREIGKVGFVVAAKAATKNYQGRSGE